MTSRGEEQQSMWVSYVVIKPVFFATVCSSSLRQCSATEPAANQNASIIKDSKSSNSRSLNQSTSAKSISFCCFCFCLARKIDRFIILICKYLPHQFDKVLNKILISIALTYIYLRSSRTFSAFDLSLHVYRICSESFSFNHDLSRYLHFSQWTSSQCRPIGGKGYSLRDETWRKRGNSVTSMSEISIEVLFYQREFIWELAWFKLDAQRLLQIFRSSCTYLLFRSNIHVSAIVILLVRHVFWHWYWLNFVNDLLQATNWKKSKKK